MLQRFQILYTSQCVKSGQPMLAYVCHGAMYGYDVSFIVSSS